MSEPHDPETGEIIVSPDTMPPAIAAAIVKVMAAVKRLGHDDNNKFAGYAFVSIDKFLESMGRLMADAKIFIWPQEMVCESRSKAAGEGDTREKGSAWLWMRWSFVIVHESGVMSAPIYRTVAVPANGAQAFGSAQSYALKQFMRGLFQIPTGDKDDPDLQPHADMGAQKAGATAKAATKGDAADKAPANAALTEKQKEASAAYKLIRQKIAAAKNAVEVDAIVKVHSADIALIGEVSPQGLAQLDGHVENRKKMLSEPATDDMPSDDLQP